MTTEVKIAASDLHEDRYSRLRLIPWWDETRIRAARVLVVGAGALGNEILKNLALLGFQKVVVVDLDRIEESNLSRAVLFRDSDVGDTKAEVAARSYESLCPGAAVKPISADVIHQVGLGLFSWSDLIIAGLDNREARLWINRAAWKTNRPWVDGAIEGINGVVRVFVPGAPPCYECTLGETDWALLERRMSCNLLLAEADVQGKVATTPTISSIIAGVEVQEAMKLIHGLPTLAGHGYIFEGLNHTSYVVEYTANADCMSHYTFGRVIRLKERSSDLTLEQLRERARQDLHSQDVTIEFSRDIIHQLVCPRCNAIEALFVPVGTVSYEQGRCPADGNMRRVVTLHSYSGEADLGDRHLDQLGLPAFDIFVARAGEEELAYLIAGDQDKVLGALAETGGDGV
jgi:molybdopterin/thiamine biosynthesis adenylyltransferase